MVSGCGQLSGIGFSDIFSRQSMLDENDTGAIRPKGPTNQGHFRGIAKGDLNGDGYPELVSANVLTGNLIIWPGLAQGSWASPVSVPVKAEILSIDLADIDADARLDVIASIRRDGGGGIEIWKNLGNLKFTRSEGPQTSGQFDDIHAVDLNFDGRADLIAVTSRKGPTATLQIWSNLGPGEWKPAAAPKIQTPLHSVTTADLNQDGLIDIIAAGDDPSSGLQVWLGKGKQPHWGNANVMAKGSFWSVSVSDMNGDEIPDVMATETETAVLTSLPAR
jgi:hypothetical protein